LSERDFKVFRDKKYSIIITIDIVEGCDVRVLDMGKNWGITQDVETRNLSDFGKLEGRRFAQCQHGLIEMPNVVSLDGRPRKALAFFKRRCTG
jgi:hypothetical protein